MSSTVIKADAPTHSGPSLMEDRGFTPLVSIITPIYNAEKFLIDTLESVRHQTYSHWELILIDDGSTDQSRALVERWMQQFPDLKLCYIRQENQGVSAARNHGFSYAKGDYVSFLDADDVWFPDKLAVDIQTIRNHQDPVCLIYSGYYVVNDKYRLTNIPKHLPISPYDFGSVVACNIFPSIALMHRNVFIQLNGFLDNKICSQEDRVFFVKACVYFPAFMTGERQVMYRQLPSGRALNNLDNLERMIRDEYNTINALRGDLNDTDFEMFQNHHVRSLMNRFLRFNGFDNAKRYAMYLPVGLLTRDPKGWLTMLSLTLNINFIAIVQGLMQIGLQTLYAPWWQFRKRSVFG